MATSFNGGGSLSSSDNSSVTSNTCQLSYLKLSTPSLWLHITNLNLNFDPREKILPPDLSFGGCWESANLLTIRSYSYEEVIRHQNKFNKF